MIPALIGSLGAGKTALAAAGWIQNNVIGGEGLVKNFFDPQIQVSPALTINGTAADYASERYCFITQVLAPTDKDIKALDDFFESFGYRVDLFKKPNLALRSTFTYVKTNGAVVYSSNKPAAAQMAAMLNNGCKFWKGDIGK
mgnify:FL=1